MNWNEEDLQGKLRSLAQDEPVLGHAHTPAVRAYLLGYAVAALGHRPSPAQTDEVVGCPIEDQDFKLLMPDKAIAFLQSTLSGLLKKVTRGQLLIQDAVVSWDRGKLDNLSAVLSLHPKKVVYGLVVLMLKDILLAVSGPADIQKISERIKTGLAFMGAARQELVKILLAMVENGFVGRLPLKKFEQKNFVSLYLFILSASVLTAEDIQALLTQKHFCFMSFAKLWPSYKKMLGVVKTHFSCLSRLRVEPSNVATVIEQEIAALFVQKMAQLPSQEAVALFTLLSQTFLEEFEHKVLFLLMQGEFGSLLALQLEQMPAWVSMLKPIEDRKTAVLLGLLVYGLGPQQLRGRWMLGLIQACSPYEIIILKGFQLGDELSRQLVGYCLQELDSVSASLDSYSKIYKCLKDLSGFSSVAFLRGMVLNAQDDAVFGFALRVLNQNEQSLSAVGACLLLESTIDRFFDQECGECRNVVAFLVQVLQSQPSLTAIIVSKLIKKAMRSGQKTVQPAPSQFRHDTVTLFEECRLGSQLLAGEKQGGEIQGCLQTIFFGQLEDGIIRSINDIFLQELRQCEVRQLEQHLISSGRFRRLVGWLLGRGVDKGPIVELLLIIILQITVKFYHEQVFAFEELQAVYQLLWNYQMVQYHDARLLAVRRYREQLVDIAKKKICQSWAVAECMLACLDT